MDPKSSSEAFSDEPLRYKWQRLKRDSRNVLMIWSRALMGFWRLDVNRQADDEA